MERVKIIVNGKEIAKRYVGSRLVWEGVVLLAKIDYPTLFKRGNELLITSFFSEQLNVSNVNKIVIGNVEITNFSRLIREGYDFKVNLTSADMFKLKEGVVNKIEFWGRR